MATDKKGDKRTGPISAFDPQGKKTRVGEVVISNCVSTDTTWAVREIAATQCLNTRANVVMNDTHSLMFSVVELLAKTLLDHP